MVRLMCRYTKPTQCKISRLVNNSKYGIELYPMGGRDCSLFNICFYKAL